jgi:hypothetical protein
MSTIGTVRSKKYAGTLRILTACRSSVNVAGLAGAVLLGACTHQIPIDTQASLPPSVETAPIPKRLGIHFSEEFRDYKHRGSRGGDGWVFPLGEGSVPLFEDTFSKSFVMTAEVDGLPPYESDSNELDAVIEPQIEDFAFDIPFLKTGDYVSEISYRFTIYSMKGEPLASWPVDGYAAKSGELGFEFSRWPGESADLAMRDAARKFAEGVRYEPEVMRWLGKQ